MTQAISKRVFYSYFDNQANKRLSGEIDLHLDSGTEAEARKKYRTAVTDKWKSRGYGADYIKNKVHKRICNRFRRL